MKDFLKFIEETEKAHFRTRDDTGANSNAMLIWNRVREFACLEKLTLDDLPTFCPKCTKYHKVGTACIFSRERMIEQLVERDINSVKSSLAMGDESFLADILRGDGFVPYNELTNSQLLAEFQELENN